MRALPGSGAYSASKAAAKYLESLRIEMRPLGVSVVTIAPGYVCSAMTKHNPYPMPFLMDADRFATKAACATRRSRGRCASRACCSTRCRAGSTMRCSNARRASRATADDMKKKRLRE